MSKKNREMLKVFFGVMKGNEKYMNLVVPNCYVKDIYDIDYKKLYKKGYRNIIFDIDNTILPVNKVGVPNELVELFKKIKKVGLNICLVSNNKKERVLPPAKILDVLYLYEAKKPTKAAFDKALKILEANTNDTVMVGDQMLSDIKGANEYGLYSILVAPVDDKYDIKTGTSRVLQNIMIKKLERKNVFHRNRYYK
ncbi:MAG: YqeG family HAD IIIA-type phosphatase [Bacilli bacterium]|nr:YqeG family HAD IIIA-type phosphatase [Bacilli bacterium]